MKYRICRTRNLEFIQMLVNEYNSTNISLKDLSKKYHTDAYYQFKMHNVPTRSKGVQRSLTRKGCFNLNWNGERILTEEQAYIVGLVFADGHISDTQMGLRLKKSDKKLIEQVKNYFSSNIKLQYYNNSYNFVVSSKQLCSNLLNLGVLKHKTSKELHIPQMQESLYKHFIRGFFDGDGTVFKSNNNGHFSLRCNICCATKGILEEINTIFQANGIMGSINIEHRKGKYTKTPAGQKTIQTLDMYRLFVRSKSSVEKLYHFLYDDCTLYLERKRQVFEDNFNLFIYKNKKSIC